MAYIFIFHAIILLLLNKVQGSLKIIKIITRMPKPKDIGLIIDVTLENVDEDCKELLAFRVRPNGYCCVNVAPEAVMGKMGRIVGGDFGFVKPGAIEKISLIWPTVSLYNRVGVCPIAITSTNLKNEQRTIKKMIQFDTRFRILDPDNRTVRNQNDFIDCQNWDRDYFKNCTSVACKERYFGLRSFYNNTSEKCEEVPLPRCPEKYLLNDVFARSFKDDAFDKLNFEKGQKFFFKDKPNSSLNVRFPHDFPKSSHLEHGNEAQWLNENKRYAWIQGLGKGLLIVFATITIYLLICFSIFLFVIWLSRRSNRGGEASGRGNIFHSRHLGTSEENIPIYTISSLMSQR